ncbi:hypothetical protein CPB84DRAFT_1735495 [Gymnopilus junonius]|uniref:Uncharacterized protein n=1 Tax=Gymnopilus junonius TaxID=109634 RepID=A0A9P5NDF3_GYMJU|nr:hypothetical protein CPB84DRAFT_1735495 [Gymnopilus junonius]
MVWSSRPLAFNSTQRFDTTSLAHSTPFSIFVTKSLRTLSKSNRFYTCFFHYFLTYSPTDDHGLILISWDDATPPSLYHFFLRVISLKHTRRYPYSNCLFEIPPSIIVQTPRGTSKSLRQEYHRRLYHSPLSKRPKYRSQSTTNPFRCSIPCVLLLLSLAVCLDVILTFEYARFRR